MSESHIPYLLLGETRRRWLEERVAAATEQWRAGWLPEHSQGVLAEIEEVRSRPTDIRAHEACCFRVQADGATPLVLIVPRRSLAGVVGAPSQGADASSRFADDRSLAAALEREALLRLSKTLLLSEASSAVSLERITASAVDIFREYDAARYVCACITISDARCMLDVLLAPTLVERLLPARPPAPDKERVERRRLAASAQLVDLDGLLGVAEVSVSELAALSVGDVIVLEQALSECGAVAVRGGERIGGAAPGRVDDKRAIQIRGRAA